MTVNRGGFRRTSTYKVSEDTALVAGMIVDITGAACNLHSVSVIAGERMLGLSCMMILPQF